MDTTDAYIARFSGDIRTRLEQLRAVIRRAAPGATEVISYGMPAARMHGILVYYAAHKGHIGFYPTASGMEKFREALCGYKQTKGAVHFPYDRPLPAGLIGRIVRFRVKEDAMKKKK